MQKKKVNIIISLLNGKKQLIECINNVIEYRGAQEEKIYIIINDNMDHPTFEYLHSLDDYITLIEDKQRLGFSANINCVLDVEKESDIVILDGDVLVTPNWIDRLVECAYSDIAIATVSPMSNITEFYEIDLEDNERTNVGLDKYRRVVEDYSLKEYPVIPYSSSFCMYIKRSVLNELIAFEERYFKDGYASCIDFCFRAIQLGYTNNLCDDVFVYYSKDEKYSLGINKFKGSKEDLKKLIDKYEKIYEDIVNPYKIKKKNNFVNDNIKFWLNFQNDKKNILYFLLADFQEDASNNIGGTQFHVKDLTENLLHDYNVFVLARDGEYLRLTAWIGERKIGFRYYIGKEPTYPIYNNKEQKNIYLHLLKGLSIDIVHVHHTWGLSLDIFYAAKDLGIPLVLSVHDYYYICPILRLANKEGEACSPEQPAAMCSGCVNEGRYVNSEVPFIEKWRFEHKKILDLCEGIVFPSKYTADTMKSFYPQIEERKINIIEHGTDIGSIPEYSAPYYEKHKKLRIAFIGGISEVKGSDLIYELITKANKEKYEWYIFGGIGVENLYHLQKDNLKKTGWYKREEIGKLLHDNEIDIVCILSIIEETFCYTLSEAVASNIPVIAKNVGALGTRMKDMQCGWLINKNDGYKEVIDLLDKISDNRDEYMEKWHIVSQCKVHSIKEMIDMYKELYEKRYKLNEKNANKEDIKFIYNSRVKDIFKAKKDVQEQNDNSIEVQALKDELEDLYRSILVRSAIKLRKVNIPFKEPLKKVLKKFIFS